MKYMHFCQLSTHINHCNSQLLRVFQETLTKADKYDPHINASFQDTANHYESVVVPARPYRLKDNAKVESSVKLVERWIPARLCRQRFFCLAELNQAIVVLPDDFNNRVMRRYDKSRYDLYLELNKSALKPLPTRRYVFRDF